MGWFWAFFWVPMGLFVASRVRRRLWRHRYHHGYFGRGHARRAHFGRSGCNFRDGYERDYERGWDLDEDEFDDEPRPFRARARGRWLSGLFRRLDTTPGQEKALRELVTGLGSSLGDARSEFVAARRELATALSGETVDNTSLDRAFQRNTELLTKLSGELKAALASAHQTLDGEQRKYLAELIGQGFRGGPFARRAFEL
ncbi:MAG TPA: periplasmic heavy metal sensor [Polyangiales bacterium]